MYRKGISVLSSGLQLKNCQLGALVASSPLHLGSYPMAFLFVIDLTTGDMIQADDMPVKIVPGWLNQGERQGKDTEVSHAKVEGCLLPKEYEIPLGLALPEFPDTTQHFWVRNGVGTSPSRIYAYNSTSYSAYAAYAICRPNGAFRRTATCTGISTFAKAGQNYVLDYHYEDSLCIVNRKHVFTGNPFHKATSVSDKQPNYTQGRYESRVYDKSSKTWSTSVLTTSNMNMFMFTKPYDASGLPSDLILSGADDSFSGRLQADLLRIEDLPHGNSEWLATRHAVESCKVFNGSTLEMMHDAYRWKSLLPPLRAFVRVASPRSWAQVYLWMIYGVLPTLRDAVLVTTAIKANEGTPWDVIAKRYAQLTTRYGSSSLPDDNTLGFVVEHKCNARATLRPGLEPRNRFDLFLNMMQLLNVEVSATNVWELVPYSFVVDWFANTKDLMGYIDYSSYYSRYRLQQLILSHKRVATVPVSRYGDVATGYVTLTTYDRSIHYTFPEATFDLRFTDPSGHWLEGAALLVSSRKG